MSGQSFVITLMQEKEMKKVRELARVRREWASCRVFVFDTCSGDRMYLPVACSGDRKCLPVA